MKFKAQGNQAYTFCEIPETPVHTLIRPRKLEFQNLNNVVYSSQPISHRYKGGYINVIEIYFALENLNSGLNIISIGRSRRFQSNITV